MTSRDTIIQFTRIGAYMYNIEGLGGGGGGVTKDKCRKGIIDWLIKLKLDFIEKDIYLAITYVAPEYSPIHDTYHVDF